MTEDQLKAFLEKAQGDDSLQEKLKTAADANAVAAIAKEAGYSISADDLTMAQLELSDYELERVTGGVKGDLTLFETWEQHMMCDAGTLESPCG